MPVINNRSAKQVTSKKGVFSLFLRAGNIKIASWTTSRGKRREVPQKGTH
jgi:hypothetical protein